jgi:hypothetical protein
MATREALPCPGLSPAGPRPQVSRTSIRIIGSSSKPPPRICSSVSVRGRRRTRTPPMSCAIVAARRIATIPPSSIEVIWVRLRVIGPPGARLAIASSSRSASSASTGPTSPSVRGARSSTCTRPLWVAQPRRAKPVSRDRWPDRVLPRRERSTLPQGGFRVPVLCRGAERVLRNGLKLVMASDPKLASRERTGAARNTGR